MTDKKPIKKRIKKKNTQTELSNWDYKAPVFFFERLTPKSNAQLSLLGRELLAWAQLPTSLVLSRFFSDREFPINMRDVYEQAERCPELKEAIAIAKQILGGRREQAGLEWKLNYQAIKETQPLYDPEYRALKAEWIKSTADHIEKIVVLPQIPTPKGEE